VRGLAVAPWFAAGAGLVLAAGLWMYSPHAELKFPADAIGMVPCQPKGCATSSGGSGSLAVTKPGVPISKPKHHASRPTASTDVDKTGVSGLTFGYVVVWQRRGMFDVMVTVTGRNAPASWRLAFAMPGDRIRAVLGASWQPSGTDGGTASAMKAGQGTGEPGSPSGPTWPGSGGGNGGGGNGGGGGRGDARSGQYDTGSKGSVSFAIIGTGTPVTPTGCVYNGASCSFS
jgi:hypothetical protein